MGLELQEGRSRRGNGGPAGWSIWRSTSSGGRIGVRNSGRNRWAAGRWRRPARSTNVGSSARGSFGVRPGTKPSCVWTLWRLSGAMSVGIYLRAHPPRQPVQKLKCAPLSARARGRPEVERRPPNPNNTPQAPLCSRRSPEKRRRPPPPCHWKALPRKFSLPQKAPAERFPGGPRTPPTNTFSKDQAGLAPAIRVPILNKDL